MYEVIIPRADPSLLTLFYQFVFRGKPHDERGNWAEFNKIGHKMVFAQSSGSQYFLFMFQFSDEGRERN